MRSLQVLLLLLVLPAAVGSQGAGDAMDSLFSSLAGTGTTRSPGAAAAAAAAPPATLSISMRSPEPGPEPGPLLDLDMLAVRDAGNEDELSLLFGTDTATAGFEVTATMHAELQSLAATVAALCTRTPPADRPCKVLPNFLSSESTTTSSSSSDSAVLSFRKLLVAAAAEYFGIPAVQVRMTSSKAYCEPPGAVVPPASGADDHVGRAHREVLGIVALAVGESAINSNFFHFSDPRPAAAMAALPEWFGTGSTVASELRPGLLHLSPPGLQRFAVRNADHDAARIYITFTAAAAAAEGAASEGGDTDIGGGKAAGNDGDNALFGAAGVKRQAEDGLWPVPVLERHLAASASGSSEQSALSDAALARVLLKIAAENESIYKSNKGGYQSTPDLFERQEHEIVQLRDGVYDALAAFVGLGPSALGQLGAEDGPPNAVLEVEIHNAWFGINNPGDSNSPHVHPASSISGVYYVACPNVSIVRGGNLHLLDPRGYGWSNVGGGDGPSDADGQCSNGQPPHGSDSCTAEQKQQWKAGKNKNKKTKKKKKKHAAETAGRLEQVIAPTPGKLILFPSYLEHWVDPFAPIRTATSGGSSGNGDVDESLQRIAIAFNARVRTESESKLTTRGVQVRVPRRHTRRAAPTPPEPHA